MATTMQRPHRTLTGPPGDRVILHGVSWETYERLLADYVDCQTPRFAYDRGRLEIVATLSSKHEEINRTLAMVIETIAAELGIDVRNVGGMTFRREDVERGFEPDSSFYIQNEARVRGREQIDPLGDPPPDLVIEVDITHDSLPKFALYAGLGIPEVWRYDEERVAIHVLQAGAYVASAVSAALPVLTSEAVNEFMAQSRSMARSEWVWALRDWAQQHGARRRPTP